MEPPARRFCRPVYLALLLLSFCVPAQELRKALPAAAQQPAASRVINIPADTSHLGIFLRAWVNNSQPLSFVLDSGAGSPMLIDSHRAQSLGLALHGKGQGGGAGESTYEIRFARGVQVRLDGAEFSDQVLAAIPLAPLEPFAGRKIDGLVGHDLFRRFVVEIDYEGQMVKLYEPQTYRYTGKGESLPLEVVNEHLHVPAKVTMPGREAIEGRFVVDTGAGPITAVLNSPFVESHKLLPVAGPSVLDNSLSGLGGETKRLVTRARSFQLGSFVMREPFVDLSRDAGGALASREFDGIIGGEFLRRFKVIFDLRRHRLILEPGPRFSEPYEYNMSGMGLRAEGEQFDVFKVHRVFENSPAAAAGVREGDRIVAIDGKPARTFTLERLYRLFKQEGREYSFEIERGAQRLRVKIRLRRMV
ncbi:MAG TPA: aspartyl protease family protein [Pyrinomonadaceae bacterium]|nr:aspartyl protease family protein [Pyrinomonadaceae bacterium]